MSQMLALALIVFFSKSMEFGNEVLMKFVWKLCCGVDNVPAPVSSLWHFPSPHNPYALPSCQVYLAVKHPSAHMWLRVLVSAESHSCYIQHPYGSDMVSLSGSGIWSILWQFKEGLLRQTVGVHFSPDLKQHDYCHAGFVSVLQAESVPLPVEAHGAPLSSLLLLASCWKLIARVKISALLSSETFPSYTKLHPSSVA